MKQKPNANLPTAFDRAMKMVKRLTPDERIALMKVISASLNGPRLFTTAEVEQYMHAAVNEYIKGQQQVGILTPDMVRRAQ